MVNNFFTSHFDKALIVLLIFAILGICSKNMIITLAVLFLFLMRMTPLNDFFYLIEKYGTQVGIFMLTISVMTPMASGKISIQNIIETFLNLRSYLAIGIGILVSWLGSRGVMFMESESSMITGLLIGNIIGISVFNGVAVGPLISAGILSLLVNKI